MAYKKFYEYCKRKNAAEKAGWVGKPKQITVGADVKGDDNLEAPPNKPPKSPWKKGAQVKEAESKGLGNLWGNDAPPGPPSPSVKGNGSLEPTTGKTVGKPSNYRGPGRDPGQQQVNDIGVGGLGNQGNTKYEPKTKGGDSPFIPGGTTASNSSWENKTKTESFLHKTKDMPLGKFAKYMIQKECSGIPAETIQAITDMAKNNSNVTKELILEMKRKKLLGKTLKEMLLFPETYQALVHLLSDSSIANSLARAMNHQYLTESVGPPIGFEDEDGMEGGDVDANADEEEGEEEVDDDEFNDEFDDDEDDDEDDEEDDEEEEEFDDEGNPIGEDEPEEWDEEEPHDDEYEDEEDQGEDDPRHFAFDHVIHAMNKFKQMRESMRK